MAGVVAPGQKATPTINAYVDAEQRSRSVEVFGDDLGRDMQNFMGGTNTYPLLTWWYHPSNCHGATRHAHDGSGNLNGNFACPWSPYCGNLLIYDRSSTGTVKTDMVATCTKARCDIVEYVNLHSATLIGNGSATWEVNGGVPSNNHFREDVIHKDLASGQSLQIYLHHPTF